MQEIRYIFHKILCFSMKIRTKGRVGLQLAQTDMPYKQRSPKDESKRLPKVAATRSVVPLIGKSGLRLEGHVLRSYSLLTTQRSPIGDAVSPLRCSPLCVGGSAASLPRALMGSPRIFNYWGKRSIIRSTIQGLCPQSCKY